MAKILLIDDDEQLLTMYQSKFVEEGLEMFTAKTGPEGLELAKKIKPDLILLDFLMPGGLHGDTVLEILKRDKDLKSIPVIMLTNLDTKELISLLKGSIEYVLKTDTTSEELVKKVKAILKIS
jgi:DNA-binding response OmpR family regulator